MALIEGYPFESDKVIAGFEDLDTFNVFALAGTNSQKASKNDRIIFYSSPGKKQIAYSYLNQYDTNKSCLPTYSDDNYLILENFDPSGEHYIYHGVSSTLYAVKSYGDTYVGSRDYCEPIASSDSSYILTDIYYVFKDISPRKLGLGSADKNGFYSVDSTLINWILGESDYSKDSLLALARELPTPESTLAPTPTPDPEPELEPYNSIIESVRGKGKLTGTKVADVFTFNSFEAFTKKAADMIIGFDASEGDTIGVSADAFPGLEDVSDINFASTKSKKKLMKLSKDDYDFVYFVKKGQLYFDGNGSDKKWGNRDEGGLVAILKGKPELTFEHITLLA